MPSQIPLLFEHADFIAIEKPYGFRTHRASETQLGLIEHCSHHRNEELWPVHRLDKGTSGVLIFARSKAAAQKFFEIFESHHIEKEYVFISTEIKNSIHKESDPQATKKSELADQSKPISNALEVSSHIEKIGAKFVSHSKKPNNSKTHLTKLSTNGQYSLWSARPQTGKPHQIRLHAEQLGFPILGDLDHSGAAFFRLALHAKSIAFDWNGQKIVIESAVPKIFEELPEQNWSIAAEIKSHLENIQPWIDTKSTDAFLFKSVSNDLQEKNQKLWSAEQLGSSIWIKNYGRKWIESDWLELEQLAQEGKQSIFVREMENRGKGVGGKEQDLLRSTLQAPDSWVIRENDVQFKMKSTAGFSPGLFLDQRENRKWVKENAKGKSVLNLFSYTGAFSVNAAIGGASQVTTVDVSSTFLNWSKENFELNKVDPKLHEFFKQDVLLFLTGAQKRSRKWDLIVCDPPTFGRSQDRVWQLSKDFRELIQSIWSCLNSGGHLLFTCNFEEWDQQKLIELTHAAITSKQNKVGLSFEPMPLPPFEYLDRVGTEQSSYGFILRKT